jgi:hypothetical protein
MGWPCGGSGEASLIIAQPCIRKQQPQQKVNYLWTPYHLSTPPIAPTSIFACHQHIDSYQCRLSQISLWRLCLIPELAGIVIRYHPIYATQCPPSMLYLTPYLRRADARLEQLLPSFNSLFLSTMPSLPISWPMPAPLAHGGNVLGLTIFFLSGVN